MSGPDDADCLAYLSITKELFYKKPGIFNATSDDSAAVDVLNLGPAASEPSQPQHQHMPLRQMPVREQPQQVSWLMQPMAAHQEQLMWQKQAAARSMHSTQQCSALSMPSSIQQQQQHVRRNATVTSEGPSRVPRQVSGLVPFAGNASMLFVMPAFNHAPGQAQLLAGRLPAAAVQPAANIVLQQQLLHMQQLMMLQAASPAPGGSKHSAGTEAAPGGHAAKNRHRSSKTHSSSRSSLDGIGSSSNGMTKAGAASRRYR
jgi:hypothetical protein